MKRGFVSKNHVGFVCAVVSACSLFAIFLTVPSLPEVSYGNKDPNSYSSTKTQKFPEDQSLGKFGEIMIAMLPQDLAFTVFVPSKKAFVHGLRLDPNISLGSNKVNDTYAIITRVLGFSTVPRIISSSAVATGKELNYDSLSGFTLHISKDVDRVLVVNGVRSKILDLRRGEMLIHVMDGVLMDVQFEQSVQPDYIDE